jgi:hypothetical protein
MDIPGLQKISNMILYGSRKWNGACLSHVGQIVSDPKEKT